MSEQQLPLQIMEGRSFAKCFMYMVFPGGTAVKNPPAMQETEIQSLDWEDSLEKEMATNSSILAWRIPQTEEPGGLQSMMGKESDMTESWWAESGTNE